MPEISKKERKNFAFFVDEILFNVVKWNVYDNVSYNEK